MFDVFQYRFLYCTGLYDRELDRGIFFLFFYTF